MRILAKTLLFLFILGGITITCNNNLFNTLRGEWMCIDDMDCPDFIFFHKSGRYIILNDCGSEHPWIPIVERGNWEIENRNIILKNREFASKFSDFRNYHGSDSVLTFNIKKFANKELILNFNHDGERYIEYYKKVISFPKLTRVYNGYGSKIKKLTLPTSGARTFLKLSYKVFLFHIAGKEEPIELIVEDQDGHELWRKTLVFSEDIQKEEILLADKSEIINLKELIFKINAGELSPSWEFQVKVY